MNSSTGLFLPAAGYRNDNREAVALKPQQVLILKDIIKVETMQVELFRILCF